MFIGLIAQGNASREFYGYVDKVSIIAKSSILIVYTWILISVK